MPAAPAARTIPIAVIATQPWYIACASMGMDAAAGAAVMSGLLKVRIPMLARRAVTLIPAIVVLGTGVNPTWALVLSQVLLSLAIPFALIPLVLLTSERALMGRYVNSRRMRILAWIVVSLIVLLNVALIVLTVVGAT